MNKLCRNFQDILPDRRKFYLTRLDTFREDWTILSSKVSANTEVAHWTVHLTLSHHYKKTLMQSIKYAAKIVFIWVLFYWRSFEEQQAHGPHLLIWLSMRFSLLVVMLLPNYPFGCHSNQSNSAFWTKCLHSVEDYSSNSSITICQHICNELEIEAYLHFFPQSGGSSLSSWSTSSARGCSCSSASSLVDCVWASPLPKWHSLSRLASV